jgi:hypothetical protein
LLIASLYRSDFIEVPAESIRCSQYRRRREHAFELRSLAGQERRSAGPHD